ncbi:calcium-binding protein [Nitrosopumilus sp. b1]|uniref:thermonuclease family protein n=1 Tax=Nitrosopumilus sp. b1 TaxID=2109907 RepID=UPI001C7162C1|nr:thermonuclease family protein [Nitrosopumilus sp. b1]KAF6242189.1 calcium-binding protein [Nitrosopumilus sp. b1]
MNKAVFGLTIIPLIITIFLVYDFNQDEMWQEGNSAPSQQEQTKVSQHSTRECSGNARCILGTVTQVIDGDTIKVDDTSIRFSLASAPELNEFGGIEARDYIASLCPVGSTALINEDDGQTEGSYERIVAVVLCNGVNLNEELLESGHGVVHTGFCGVSEFASETWAQKYGCAPEFHSAPKVSPVQSNCDPSYPSICLEPGLPDLNCKDISQRNFEVVGEDPHGFDGDRDGIGCES